MSNQALIHPRMETHNLTGQPAPVLFHIKKKKKFKWDFFYFNLCPLPLILILDTIEKSLDSSCIYSLWYNPHWAFPPWAKQSQLPHNLLICQIVLFPDHLSGPYWKVLCAYYNISISLFHWEPRSGQRMGSQFSSTKFMPQGIPNFIPILLYNQFLWKGVTLGMDDDSGMIKIKHCFYGQATKWKEMRYYVWVQLQ